MKEYGIDWLNGKDQSQLFKKIVNNIYKKKYRSTF